MAENKSNQFALVQRYRLLVEEYEALDSRIDSLIMASKGVMEKMSPADLIHYRQLARQRTELLNDMRMLEQQLDLTGDDAPGAK